MKILILSSSYSNYATKQLIKAIENRGHKAIVLDPKKIHLYISSSEFGYDKLYDGYNKEMIAVNERSFDAVIPRVTNTNYASFIIEHLHKNLNIFTTASAKSLLIASNKMRTQQVASINGIAVPKTILFNGTKHLKVLVEKVGGFPLVMKEQFGSKGYGVSKISDFNTLLSVVQNLSRYDSKLILQEYIKSKEDYRAIVINDKVVLAMKRVSSDKKEFRANLSLGGKSELVTLTNEQELFCIKSAKAIGMLNCGIDFIMKEGKPIFIEGNRNYGYRIQKLTDKVSIANELIKFIEEQINIKKEGIVFNGSIPKDPYSEIMLQDKKIKELEKKLSFYNNNKYMLKVYENLKGQSVKYRDRKGEKRIVVVTNISDTYEIVFNTLNID